MNYFSVGTADVKSMSYLMPNLGRSEVDELLLGRNGRCEVDVLDSTSRRSEVLGRNGRFEVDVLFLGQDGRSGYMTPGYTDQ